MADYMRSPAMFEGGPFHCFNCQKRLAIKIRAGNNFQVEFRCPRCRAYILIKTMEPIPFVEKANSQRKEYLAPKKQENKGKETGATL